MKLILENVRGSYVYVTTPRKKDGEEVGYGMQIILDKKEDKELILKIKKGTIKVAKEKFGDKIKVNKNGTIAGYKTPIRDGDEEREGEEFEGKVFLNANAKLDRKPGLVNKYNKKPTEQEIADHCFSGAYFNVSINLYPFDNESKGVAVGLNNVMMCQKDAERLDGTMSAESEFAGYASEDASDDFASGELDDDLEDDDLLEDDEL